MEVRQELAAQAWELVHVCSRQRFDASTAVARIARCPARRWRRVKGCHHSIRFGIFFTRNRLENGDTPLLLGLISPSSSVLTACTRHTMIAASHTFQIETLAS